MSRAVVLIVCLTLSALLLAPSSALADGFTFTTIPENGNVSGPTGSIIGWGYTLTNNSTDWLNAISLSADPFVHASVNTLFDFPILAPGSTVSVPYDRLTGLGLYELTWDADAPAGFVNTGSFDLTVEWWDGDPLAGGNLLLSDVHRIIPYSATVQSPDINPVPEPSPLLSLVVGLGALCWIRRTTSFRSTSLLQLNVISFNSKI